MDKIVTIIVSLINLGLLCFVVFKKKVVSSNSEIYNIIEKENDKLKKYLTEVNTQLNSLIIETIKINNSRDGETLKQVDNQVNRLAQIVDEKLTKIYEFTSKQLSEIKQTVDNELNKNLTSKLNESFKMVSERLESLYRGLGEIKNLSTGVSDLRRVLSGVKTRGMLGEVQLNALLEQMLASNQFLTNVVIKPNSAERVEFAIILPGKDEQNILLPIDAKFPIEDYARLCDFSDRGMKAETEQISKQIEQKIKQEAKKISEKYIFPPVTTDFAIMYVPTEGLFAEIMRNVGLVEEIQHKFKIIICSPTTISALLSSLQMGFKTLFIEKRSSEIWQLLSAFKHEFSNFSELINKTQKKITEASNTLEDASKKTNKIQKQLNKVAENVPNYVTFENEE